MAHSGKWQEWFVTLFTRRLWHTELAAYFMERRVSRMNFYRSFTCDTPLLRQCEELVSIWLVYTLMARRVSRIDFAEVSPHLWHALGGRPCRMNFYRTSPICGTPFAVDCPEWISTTRPICGTHFAVDCRMNFYRTSPICGTPFAVDFAKWISTEPAPFVACKRSEQIHE